jgi:small ligand-binding sensory domain FIST
VPSAESSCVRRPKSNTPLQALMTLNETLSMEAAQALAKRMVSEGGGDDSSRINHGFKLCTGRSPTATETKALSGLLQRQTKRTGDGKGADIADPYTVEAERLLARADRLGIDVVGGFTGGYGAGSARLLTRDGIRTAGAVAIRFDVPGVEALVSQGARPIGNDLVITAAEGNVVLELAGKPAAEQLHSVLGALSADDLQLARTGLMAGIVIDENRPEYDVGDFLVRGLLGVAAERHLVVFAVVRVAHCERP